MTYFNRMNAGEYQTRSPDFGFGPSLGLTQAERRKYNLFTLARALAFNDRALLTSFGSQTREIARATGQPDTAFLVARDYLDFDTRTMTTATGGKGGYLVAPSLAGFSNAIQRSSLIDTLPIQRLQVENVGTVVKATLAAQNAVSWLAGEGVSGTPTEETIGNVSMVARTSLAAMDVSEQLLRQTDPAVAQYALQQQLLTTTNEAHSTAMLVGAGGAEPLGIFNTPGIDTRTGATFNIAAGAGMIKVSEGYDNGDSVVAVASLDGIETLRQRAKVASGERFMVENGRLLDVPIIGTRAMTGARMVVAPWSSVVMCQWGALQIDVDRTSGFNTAGFRIRLLGYVDFACERPAQIAVATAIS